MDEDGYVCEPKTILRGVCRFEAGPWPRRADDKIARPARVAAFRLLTCGGPVLSWPSLLAGRRSSSSSNTPTHPHTLALPPTQTISPIPSTRSRLPSVRNLLRRLSYLSTILCCRSTALSRSPAPKLPTALAPLRAAGTALHRGRLPHRRTPSTTLSADEHGGERRRAW